MSLFVDYCGHTTTLPGDSQATTTSCNGRILLNPYLLSYVSACQGIYCMYSTYLHSSLLYSTVVGDSRITQDLVYIQSQDRSFLYTNIIMIIIFNCGAQDRGQAGSMLTLFVLCFPSGEAGLWGTS